MPCCSCTTGSPTLTSERSRSMPSAEVRRSASRPRAHAGLLRVELVFGDERKPFAIVTSKPFGSDEPFGSNQPFGSDQPFGSEYEAGMQRADPEHQAGRLRRRIPGIPRRARDAVRARPDIRAASRAGRALRRAPAPVRETYRGTHAGGGGGFPPGALRQAAAATLSPPPLASRGSAGFGSRVVASSGWSLGLVTRTRRLGTASSSMRANGLIAPKNSSVVRNRSCGGSAGFARSPRSIA